MSNARQKQQFRYQGIACGLAAFARAHGEPTMVCDVLRDLDITFEDLRAARVEDFDLHEIRKCLEQGNASDRAQIGK